jgi:hypothetical protein
MMAVYRPETKIDLDELEKLCGMQCTDEEIAAFFGVSTRTIEGRRKTPKFNEVMERAKAKGRVSVRRSLFRLAAGGGGSTKTYVRVAGNWVYLYSSSEREPEAVGRERKMARRARPGSVVWLSRAAY